MAVQIKNEYTGDGSTVLFSFTFPYIEQSDVYVQLDGVDTTEYTFANVTTIEMDTPPADGVDIVIYRNTQVESIENVFYPGSAIRAKDLNDNFTQSLYVIQEGDLNVGEAVQDATEALETANEALDKSEQAIETANAADAKSDQALEAAENANAVQIGIKPEYNTPGDKDSGIRNLYNEYPQKLGKGMTLPDQDETWEEDGALRLNKINEKLEVHIDGDWTTASAGAEVKETPPEPATQGDVWWDPSDGRSYVYYTDADSSQWVEMNPSWNGSVPDNGIDSDKIQDGAVTPEKLDREYVERIIGGENVTVDPADGKGVVTINAPASGGGGGTVINYNGSSAWVQGVGTASFDDADRVRAGHNVAGVVRNSTGNYTVTFTTPMSSSFYSAQATPLSGNRFASVLTLTPESLVVRTNDSNSGAIDTNFNLTVFDSNAIAPQAGVGADAWGSFIGNEATPDADRIQGGFNIDEVVRNSVGNYSITFIEQMPTADYAVFISTTTAQQNYRFINKTTTGFGVVIKNSGTSVNTDSAKFDVTVFASSTVTPTYTWTRKGTVVEPVADVTEVKAPSGGSVVGYQEGFWTAVPNQGTISGGTQCSFMRIGNSVTITGNLRNWSDSTNTDEIEITGFPYDRGPTSSFAIGAARLARFNFADNKYAQACLLLGPPSLLKIGVSESGQSGTYFKYSDIVTGQKAQAQFAFTVTYQTDDTTWQPANGATVQ